jgi:hypothetical protein
MKRDYLTDGPYKGAIWVRDGAEDYDEGQDNGPDGPGACVTYTWKRIQNANKYEEALRRLELARNAAPLIYNTGSKIQDRIAEGVWLRTHYLPHDHHREWRQNKKAKAKAVPIEARLAALSMPVKPPAPPQTLTVSQANLSLTDEIEPPDKRLDIGAASDFKDIVLPVDNSRELDLRMPENISLEDELKRMQWIRIHAQDVLARKISLRQIPWESAWFGCNVALTNPVAFEARYAKELIEYHRQFTEEAKAAEAAKVKALHDANSELFDVFDGMGATAAASAEEPLLANPQSKEPGAADAARNQSPSDLAAATGREMSA